MRFNMRGFFGRWRYISLSVLFLLSSLALSFSPFLTGQASATSFADQLFNPTSTAKIRDTSCTGSGIDIGFTWLAILNDTNSWNGTYAGSSNISSQKSAFISEMTSTFANTSNTGWAVTTFQTGYTGTAAQYVIVTITPTNTNYVKVLSSQYSRGAVAYIANTDSTPVYSARIKESTDCSHAYVNDVGSYNGTTEDTGYGTWPINNLAICDNASVHYVGPTSEDCSVTGTNRETGQFFINSPISYPSGYVGPHVPPARNFPNLNVTALVSSYSVAFTADQDSGSQHVAQFLWDFDPGDGTNLIDYATHTDSHVTYYSDSGYQITHSTVNGDNLDSNQINYTWDQTTTPLTKNVCLTSILDDSSEYTKCIPYTIGTAGTVTFFGTNNPATTVVNKAPIVCGDWDIWCKVTQFIQALFTPNDNYVVTAFTNFSTDDHGLAGIITAPIVFIQGLLTTSCSPVSLPLPYVSSSLTLPCMYSTYVANFGDAFTLYQTITNGVISYYVLVGYLRIIKNFKNPWKDEIEVLDL